MAGIPEEPANSINHILLIEDDPLLPVVLKASFQQAETAEFVIERAASLEAAIALLGSHEIDIVLLDLNLPDSRGLETFSKIQRIAPELPVIILSGVADEELAVESVRAGAQDYFVKGSMSTQLLVRAVRYALERKQLQRQLAEYACQLRVRNEAIESELQMARDIQRAYLPLGDADFPSKAAPTNALLHVHSRFQPAAELGGDFFDILEVSETKIGVFICDVMGHGLSAGLVAGVVRGLIEEARPFAANPGAFLTELNRGMRAVLCHTDGPIFATGFYLIADLGVGEIRYANAGHPSPLFREQITGEVAALSSGFREQGPALGLFGDSNYTVGRRPLRPNDLCVLYTDGLYEATDREGRTFGSERLFIDMREMGHHPIAEIFDVLLEDAKTFTGRETFEDDVCILGLQPLPSALEQDEMNREQEENGDDIRALNDSDEATA
jgi:serine phosphatase RsbU (regulator of sigma subunit)